MAELKHNYISVSSGLGQSYGGNQMRSGSSVISSCGCGLVAALDVLLYLYRYHGGGQVDEFSAMQLDGVISLTEYEHGLRWLNRRYFPLIPRFGMNGITLAVGMNAFFLRHKMPFRAVWGVRESRLWSSIDVMLEQDIPVIMAVGPNFPRFWQKNNASFYAKRSDGSYASAASTRAHFVIVTGTDDEWVRISSWGRMYFINKKEFSQYVHANSINFLSSILRIENKGWDE